MSRAWTCQRVTAGERCRHKNAGRVRNCRGCGKPRPARKRPAHMVALDLTYEQYVELNGGDHCAICKRPRDGRRLDRDHDHATGEPRGLLCHRCNRALPSWITAGWLDEAARYLGRRQRLGTRTVRPLAPRLTPEDAEFSGYMGRQ